MRIAIDEIIIEEHEMKKVNLYDLVYKFDYTNKHNYKYSEYFDSRKQGLIFDQKNNIISLNDFYTYVIFHSNNKVNLIEEFLNILNIKLYENKYLWIHEVNFNSDIVISKNEIIGDDNLKIIFI